jgi:hypothetical protein
MAKSTEAVKNSSPAKATPPERRSPGKGKKAVPMRQKKTPLTLYVVNFGPPFTFEIYFYEKNIYEDGFTNGVLKYMRGNEAESHEGFDDANFTKALSRRVAGSADIVAKSAETNYDRRIFLRYPKESESTPKTRVTGLAAMKSFLQDPRFSRYPPTEIETVDLTDYQHAQHTAMDNYIMNNDIQELVLEDCNAEDLNDDFKKAFPEVASCIWKSNNAGEFGRSLGF